MDKFLGYILVSEYVSKPSPTTDRWFSFNFPTNLCVGPKSDNPRGRSCRKELTLLIGICIEISFQPKTEANPKRASTSMPRAQLATVLALSWQCQRCNQTNDSAKNKKRCCSCQAWRDNCNICNRASMNKAHGSKSAGYVTLSPSIRRLSCTCSTHYSLVKDYRGGGGGGNSPRKGGGTASRRLDPTSP
jgi:hypothetical protein